MKKNIGVLGVAIALSVALTGCVKGDFHVTVNKNGSAIEDYTLEESTMIYDNKPNDPLNQFKEATTRQGFNVSTFKDGDYIGVHAKRNDKDMSKLATDILGNLSTRGTKPKITVQKGIFQNLYTVDADIDLRDSQTIAAQNGKAVETSSLSSSIGQMFADKVDLKLDMTLPVDTEQNNASRVLAGKSQTYEWDLLIGQDNKVELQASVLNVWNVVYASLLGVALLGVIGFGLQRYRKTKTAS